MAIKLIFNHFDRNSFNNHSEYRKHIEAHLKAVLTNRTALNLDSNIVIGFNKVGIEKMVSTIGSIKAHALCNLQPIIRNSLLFSVEKDRKDRPDVLCVRLFKLPVEIQGNVYEVWSYVRETKDGHYLYCLNIDTKKTL